MALLFLLDVLQFILFAIGCYYVIISLFSLEHVRGERKNNRKNTFALLVAAHNEESVIKDIVESLKSLDYPKDKYQIFVVADNCTDQTAEIAKDAGAVVLERFDNTKRGKGYAMEFAFDRIFGMEEKYEYFCVFDADNIIKKDFLIHMNDKINEGYRAVQGYLDSKNPSDNWLTFSYSLWYWINNRLTQLSRGNLGIGCRLGGTGFAVEADLIKQHGWGATCLAEDIEFTLKLALSDIKVGWAHEAVVYDEKPRDMGVSVKQRQRWSQGIADVASRYIMPLLKKGIKETSLAALHMVMNFWGDALYLVSMGVLTLEYIAMFFVSKTSTVYELFCRTWDEPWKMFLLTTLVVMNNVLVVAALYNDRKLDKCVLKNIAGFIFYIISWIPVGIIGALKKNKKEWFHTPHSGSDR